MNRRLAFTLAAGITAAALSLTGCGAELTGTAPGTAPSASSQTSAATEPSTSAAETTPPAPSADNSPSEQTGDGGDKPSKQEIVTGLSKFYRETQGLSADKAKKFAVCMVDEMYGKAKTATLQAMRDGDPTAISQSDAGLVAEAGVACQPALA